MSLPTNESDRIPIHCHECGRFNFVGPIHELPNPRTIYCQGCAPHVTKKLSNVRKDAKLIQNPSVNEAEVSLKLVKPWKVFKLQPEPFPSIRSFSSVIYQQRMILFGGEVFQHGSWKPSNLLIEVDTGECQYLNSSRCGWCSGIYLLYYLFPSTVLFIFIFFASKQYCRSPTCGSIAVFWCLYIWWKPSSGRTFCHDWEWKSVEKHTL